MQPAPTLPAIECAHRTDAGRDPNKRVNEDALDLRETRFGHLFVVCDGMGGHAAGREASQLALATILESFEQAPDGCDPARVLQDAIEEANRRVYVLRRSEVGLGHPGSTVVAALLHAHGTEIAHVGDSRAYLVHQGQIYALTRDHSIVRELLERGLLSAQQASRHPDANRITRALGIAPDVEVELRPQPVQHVAGDAFVLCSDGLSDLVEDREILAIVGDEPPAQAVGKLVDLANARGGHDNITVLVVRSRESAVAATLGLTPTLVEMDVATPTQPPSVQSGRPSQPVHAQTSQQLPQGARPGPAPFSAMAAPPTAASSPPSTPRSVRPAGDPMRPVPPPEEAMTRLPDPPPDLPALGAVRMPRRTPGPRQPPTLLIAALILATLAILLLGSVLLTHLAERRGKRNTAEPSSMPTSV